MAWNYPVHACGHNGERINLVGPQADRVRRMAAIERNECPECRSAKGAAESAAQGLPALTGSPKQIAWAEQIRREARRATPGDLARQTRAGWWIDNRYTV